MANVAYLTIPMLSVLYHMAAKLGKTRTLLRFEISPGVQILLNRVEAEHPVQTGFGIVLSVKWMRQIPNPIDSHYSICRSNSFALTWFQFATLQPRSLST